MSSMHVEVFPREKTCEQGCVHCPLANRGKISTQVTAINPEVQRSFTLFEGALQRSNIRYNLHTASGTSLSLFPTIQHPQLVHMARFETNQQIGFGDNIEQFSNGIQMLVLEHGLDPKVIGFSIVPKSPLVSVSDANNVSRIISALSWHFDKTYRTIDVTVRSNLVSPATFHLVSAQLLDSDHEYFGGFLSNWGNQYQWKTESPFNQAGDLYYNEYLGRRGSRRITISNRIIAFQKESNLSEYYYHQAVEHYLLASDVSDIAIAPKGVMMMHTSLAINNPILWVSHDDFKVIVKRNLGKGHFSPKKLIRNTIKQNILMYKYVQRMLDKDEVVPQNEYMKIFEELRARFQSF